VTPDRQRSEPRGFGGWLIFPILGTVFAPFWFVRALAEILPLTRNPEIASKGIPSEVRIFLIYAKSFAIFP
jgi:hypothetical protein